MPLQTVPLTALSMQQLLDMFNNEWHGANEKPSRLMLIKLALQITHRVLSLPQ